MPGILPFPEPAAAVPDPPPDPPRPPVIVKDPDCAVPFLLPLGPVPVPLALPALAREEPSPALADVPSPAPATLPPVVAEPPRVPLAPVEGPTINDPDSSALGTSAEASAGTPTALRTTTASGATGAFVEN